MVLLITGATHTGKTRLAQSLLERYHIPYLSLDHLKMGLIRSHQTDLTPEQDDKLTDYLWPITREMIHTVLENEQHLIIEGKYILFDWAKDFPREKQEQIRLVCLVMTENYIRRHWADIKAKANVIEQRLLDATPSADHLIAENRWYYDNALKHGSEIILIDEDYTVDLVL